MKTKAVSAITVANYEAIDASSGIVIKRSGKGGSEGQAVFSVLPLLQVFTSVEGERVSGSLDLGHTHLHLLSLLHIRSPLRRFI